jgi:outer membrane immunogenic protein
MLATRTLAFGLVAATMMTSGAGAADAFGGFGGGPDSIFSSSLFNFEGFYAGATAGGGTFPTPGLVGTVGVVAGTNFALNDAFLAGVEFQGDALWNGGGFVGFNALFLGKLGGYLSDDMIAYGTAGGGWVDGAGSYALGAGIEMAVADQISVRGEGLATGSWGGMPNGGKVTVGLIWHMN